MKIRFYVDIWSGLNPTIYGLFAHTNPGAKSDSCKRVAFDVVIPDSILFEVDAVAPEVSKVELIEENNHE